MQIRPTSNIQTSQPVNLQTRNTTESASNSLPVDQLDISAEAQMLTSTQGADGVRADRVADIRSQIADGVYETPEKMDAALTRLLDQIA